MFGFAFVFIGISLISSTLALQVDLAGIVDWHLPLIGEPLLEPTPPLYVGSDRIVGLTKRNVLVVLNANNGDVVWRHQFEDIDPVVSFHVKDDNVLLLSGPGGSTARLFSLSTGSLAWEKPLVPDHQFGGVLTTPVHLGTDVSFIPSHDGESGSIVILSDGKRITKLRLDNGGQSWATEVPGAGSTILFKQIVSSGSSIHVLGIQNSIASQTLLTTTLHLESPIPKGDLGQIPSIVKLPEQALISPSLDKDGEAVVTWTEHGRIRMVSIKENGAVGKDIKDLLPGKGKVYEEILDVGTRRRGIILGRRSDGAADVINVDKREKVTEFELSATSTERSASVYSGIETSKGVLLNRVYWSYNMAVGVSQTINIADVSSKDVISSGFTFPYDTVSHGTFLHVAGSPTLSDKQLPTLVLTTSSGAIQRMELDKPGWIREESLADIKAARFVDLGEPETEEVREVLAEETFAGRLGRHLAELKDLPSYLIRFARRFTAASYTSALRVTPLNTTHLHRDQFGFQKLLIAATAKGKVFALDSSNGATIWSKNLGLTSEKGSEIEIQDIWNVRDGEGGREPMLAILATKTVGDVVKTVAYHLDAYTGLISGEVDPVNHLPLGKTLFEGRYQDAFPLPFENCGTKATVLAVIDPANSLHIFPPCKKVAAGIEEIADKLFYTTHSKSIDGTLLKGHIPSAAQEGLGFKGEVVWQHPFDQDEIILETKAVIFDAVASFGRVLGDKSTLYKYLNPHLQVISTFTPSLKGLSSVTASSQSGTGKIYVIDSTNGKIVYQTEIEGVIARGGIKVGMVENWLVFAWLDERAWKIASTELYEDTSKKGITPSQSTFEDTQIKAISQTFILHTAVKALGFTTSKAGITTKEVIIVNGKNQIATIHRRLLDPRRPVGKPSSMDKEEMLIPYEPLVPVEPKKVISHRYEVLGAETLLTSSALVESTSLLFAYGLDLFLTRGITPSGTFDILSDNFNKAQLLLTLGALSVGILVAGPAVKRKELKNKWY
ncbi:uncharacterized protein I303_101524 [Kwoniella dejecticola CBS 10117]|uniref:ER membrane protein complex subunit 1 n=1 Tax=Kwoniella dejecticola CBS 10117 TaxID=1296121 RepID=A0A1A6ADI4_9TREE|nr:uncharacterized protein I303_02344 [Kwoniella dejecticola CBS 10117]OBR88125.1 hypothetical protein I303_02344 [Kwoniella dejecticola CBS 10117]